MRYGIMYLNSEAETAEPSVHTTQARVETNCGLCAHTSVEGSGGCTLRGSSIELRATKQ